jgi:putative endonuclease
MFNTERRLTTLAPNQNLVLCGSLGRLAQRESAPIPSGRSQVQTFSVYVVHSERTGRFYIGWTVDLSRRLIDHNASKTRSLRGAIPLRLVYEENFETLVDARRRERYFKRMKSHNYLQIPDRIFEDGRLAQRESACFTRKRSQVQTLHRPPLLGAEVAERQTRCVQGAVPDRAWGFKSPLRHQRARS